MIAAATGSLDNLFLKASYTRATEALAQVSDEIEEQDLEGTENRDKPGALDKLKDVWFNIKNTIKLEERIRLLRTRVSEYTHYIIDLIIVFILQTILIPLFIFWILLRLVSSFFGFNALGFFERKIFGRSTDAIQ
jgi:hypothetical protein